MITCSRLLLCFCISCFFLAHTAKSQSLYKADSLRLAANYIDAIAAYDIAIKTLPSLSVDAGNAYLRKGVCCKYLQKNEAAVIEYFKALKIFEAVNVPERIAATVSNIAAVYFLQLDYTAALKYLRQSGKLYLALKDSAMIAEVLNDEAVIERRLGNLPTAIAYHREALGNYTGVMSGNIWCRHLFHLGSCFGEKDVDSSLHYYFKAEEKAREEEDSVLLYLIYLNIGYAFNQQKNYTEGIKFLSKSLALNDNYGDSSNLSIIYQNLAEVYDSLKQFEKAYRYSIKGRELNEAIYNVSKTKFAAELSEKYESDKKDQTIKTQQTENKLKTRNLLLSLTGLALVAALAGISFINYRRKQKANIALQLQNEKIEKLNKELDASNQVKSKLFSVISHDIRGPISSIYTFLQMQNLNESSLPNMHANNAVSKQTEQLLDTLEDLLVWSKSQLHQFTPFNEKVMLHQLIDQTIELLKPCAGILEIENRIDENQFVITDLNMLTIILRNAIANAIKYAVPRSTVTLQSGHTENCIFIKIINRSIVTDDMTMFNRDKPAINSDVTGLGITLIKEFTEKLHGSVNYSFSDQHVITEITLPLS